MRFVLRAAMLLALGACQVRSTKADAGVLLIPIDAGSRGGSSGGSSGGGIEVCAHPSFINFGPTQVLGTPATQTVAIGNCTLSPLGIAFYGIQGPQAGDFSESGESDVTLLPGQAEIITLSFSPAVLGPSTADLAYGCPACRSETLNLTGTGVDGALTFSPSPVTFAGVAAASTVVAATNTGSELLTVTKLGTLNNNGIFSVSGAPALPIPLQPLQDGACPAGATCAFSLTVAYNSSGNPAGDSDQLLGVFTVADKAVAPRTVYDQLSGTGPATCSLSIVPTALAFGNVPLGQTVTQQTTLSDNGNAACQVSQIALSAGTDPYFALGAGQPLALNVLPGKPQTITVTFSPTSSAPPLARTGQLTFQTGDPTNPNVSVPLSATITPPPGVYAPGWPKWHADDFNSGRSVANTGALQGVVAWKFNIGVPGGDRTYINSPVISTVTGINPAPPYVIYQVDMQGVLHALTNTGAQAFQQPLSGLSGDPQPATPAVLADGSMVVAYPSNLYYLSNTGTVTFSEAFDQGGFGSCPIFAPDGTLLLADRYGGSAACGGVAGGAPSLAVAFAVDAGVLTQAVGLALPFPAVAGSFGVAVDGNDTSYWGNNGQFIAVSSPLATFAPLAAWPACGVTLTPSGVTAVSNLAYDAAVPQNLYAYSAWETSTPDAGYTVQGNIAALNPATGRQNWIFDVPAASMPAGWTPLQSDVGNASPAVSDANGAVYVGSGSGLLAIASATGAQQWLFPSANVSSSPAIGGDGTIFFGCDDGTFYAVTPAGALRFKITTGGPISSSPAIAPDGTVIFVSDDGNVYAVQ